MMMMMIQTAQFVLELSLRSRDLGVERKLSSFHHNTGMWFEKCNVNDRAVWLYGEKHEII